SNVGHFIIASCTRLSPKSRWPASINTSISSADRVLLTAISWISDGSRRARAADAAMPSTIAWRRPAAETARSELEGGADVDSLAVAPIVGDRGEAIPFDIIPDAAGHSDSLRERISPANVERVIIAPAQRRERVLVAALGANRDPAGELLK